MGTINMLYNYKINKKDSEVMPTIGARHLNAPKVTQPIGTSCKWFREERG